jgi:hypothetical protein
VNSPNVVFFEFGDISWASVASYLTRKRVLESDNQLEVNCNSLGSSRHFCPGYGTWKQKYETIGRPSSNPSSTIQSVSRQSNFHKECYFRFRLSEDITPDYHSCVCQKQMVEHNYEEGIAHGTRRCIS